MNPFSHTLCLVKLDKSLFAGSVTHPWYDHKAGLSTVRH